MLNETVLSRDGFNCSFSFHYLNKLKQLADLLTELFERERERETLDSKIQLYDDAKSITVQD